MKDPILDAIYQKHYGNNKSKKEVSKLAVKAKVAVIKKEAVAKKEAKGPNITGLWEETLANAIGKRLTDISIAAQMCSAADTSKIKHKKYNEADVASCRSLYNKGKLTTQKGIVPKEKLVQFEAPTPKKGK